MTKRILVEDQEDLRAILRDFLSARPCANVPGRTVELGAVTIMAPELDGLRLDAVMPHRLLSSFPEGWFALVGDRCAPAGGIRPSCAPARQH